MKGKRALPRSTVVTAKGKRALGLVKGSESARIGNEIAQLEKLEIELDQLLTQAEAERNGIVSIRDVAALHEIEHGLAEIRRGIQRLQRAAKLNKGGRSDA